MVLRSKCFKLKAIEEKASCCHMAMSEPRINFVVLCFQVSALAGGWEALALAATCRRGRDAAASVLKAEIQALRHILSVLASAGMANFNFPGFSVSDDLSMVVCQLFDWRPPFHAPLCPTATRAINQEDFNVRRLKQMQRWIDDRPAFSGLSPVDVFVKMNELRIFHPNFLPFLKLLEASQPSFFYSPRIFDWTDPAQRSGYEVLPPQLCIAIRCHGFGFVLRIGPQQ